MACSDNANPIKNSEDDVQTYQERSTSKPVSLKVPNSKTAGKRRFLSSFKLKSRFSSLKAKKRKALKNFNEFQPATKRFLEDKPYSENCITTGKKVPINMHIYKPSSDQQKLHCDEEQ